MNGTGAYALLALPFFGVTAVVAVVKKIKMLTRDRKSVV